MSFCVTANFVIFAQKPVEIIKFRDLEVLMHQNDRLYVINFWATWCKPCVAELPVFETLSRNFSSKQISVVFVSLDFKQNHEDVTKFINEHQITAQVYLIDEPNYDSWIDKVSVQWSGAIPATLILKGSKREFYEQSFDYQTLTGKIQQFF